MIKTGDIPRVDVPEPGTTEPVRVLVVEHDARAALLLGEMLRTSWPERVVIAQTQRLGDATQELLEHGATCVLLDLSLPASDPLTSVDEIRSAAPGAAIVALAERADEEVALETIRAGAQDVLVKAELSPVALRRSVRYAIVRKRSEVHLAELALHDPLTGLPNRALFLDRLGVALDRSRRTSASVAVLFLDVDDFKDVNDKLGHAAGDVVLTELADRLRRMLRPMDTVARFGGDEFTLLFEDLASEREVVLIAERISHAATLPITLDDGEASITVSIGIAMVADPSIAPETAIREADAAMYRAKELGPSRYELSDETSRLRAMERLELESALNHAVDRSELRVHYQPKVSLSGELGVTGFEALVRWQHPERGLIAPAEFMPLAEETGAVLRIGEYVVGEALREISRWRQFKPGITVSVNLSARQLEDTSLAGMLAGAMHGADVDPGALCVEVTESSVMRNPEAAIRTLARLKTIGVQIAIDDFGTGSSSLTDLKRLPIDALKIHESFVGAIGGHPEDASIIGAVVDLGHALGLDVAAEGVETDAQLAELRSLGCDDAQGFLLGRPVPAEDVHALLAAA
ncbi:MAG TPA: EAL domain-containing protein [Solirubrobacteraceae bacterium]